MGRDAKTVTLRRLEDAGVIAVLRASTADRAIAAGSALVEAGVVAIEVTFTVPDAPRVMRELRSRHGAGAIVGAGTVTSVEHVDRALEAGAEFLVSPGHAPAVTERAVASGAATMIGAFTATEVMAVLAAGADVVKFFPGGLAGPAGIAALRAPFPGARFIPTGGVSAANLASWFAAGAVAVGAGGELVPSAAVESGDLDAIRARASEFIAALRDR
ncbi:bifunctional 4-hydroxy-2-oxoglutarate aldolase/2-dehydro-3-deoxy-phosphogluconate aldolase [Leucobacter zeae]|nr:bifunctional 4-hydroxy-2-oxoglutarate aldolase/2-dehydro-3-deoxy-phosphogluconate aldolase [Leucobacter zeae]